jgi:hypothetical protein
MAETKKLQEFIDKERIKNSSQANMLYLKQLEADKRRENLKKIKEQEALNMKERNEINA